MMYYIDSNQEHTPMRQAKDAILLDNTNLTAKETLQKTMKFVKKIIEA